MNIVSELIAEIVSDSRYRELYDKIRDFELKSSLKLNESEVTTAPIDENDERYLTEAAGLLALSKNEEDLKAALTISTILPRLSASRAVMTSSILTLNRLTNFPSIPLVLEGLSDELHITEYKDNLDLFASLEAFIQEKAYTVNFLEEPIILTKFQKKVVDLVSKRDASSISAPTSAGKSFVLLRYLLDVIYRTPGVTVIYIVPTRALIRQVMDDIFKIVSNSRIKNVFVSCSSDIENVADRPDISKILVLTQERLYQLCSTQDSPNLDVRLLIIDEAQEIQHGDRGVLLEEAIKYSLKLWRDLKVLFAAPLISNPEILLKTFGFDEKNADFDTSTVVRQNLIKATKNEKSIVINEISGNEEKLIGIIDFVKTGKGTSKARILCDYVMSLWNGQTSIVYSSEPIDSARTARFLYETGSFSSVNEDDLNEFADFIEEHIHPKYELAKFIRSGIAFHFSKLPANVKYGVEDFVKSGLIKIVCCTSTLLEGLNLPAKNVFVYRPTRGNDPLKGIDFWNLAGRAGRMGKDLSGNIICIEPDNWTENPVNAPKTQAIQPALERRLKEETEQVSLYVKDRGQGSGRDDYNEQIVSLVVRNRLELGERLTESKYETSLNKRYLEEIDNTVEEIIKDYIAPIEVLKQNPGILPDRINPEIFIAPFAFGFTRH